MNRIVTVPEAEHKAAAAAQQFCLLLSEVNLGITYGSLTGAFGPTNSSLSAKYHTLITPSGRVQGEQNERAKLQDQNCI